MNMIWRLLPALLALFLVGPPAVAQTRGDNLQNSANNPLTPKMAFDLHNYASFQN
jgi:hypothetical protein